MSFWKPGAEYPDREIQDKENIEDGEPSKRINTSNRHPKLELSENMKNMPFMMRSTDEKLRRKEEVAALKELKSYMWYYRKVNPIEEMVVSTHPCCGDVVNTTTEEECKRFSFGGFNPKVDLILKERMDYRDAKSAGNPTDKTDIFQTLNKYSTIKGMQKPKRGSKRSHD